MKLLGKLFFRGLAAILPLALTGWLIWAALVGTERLLSRVLLLFIPEDEYHAGEGLLLAVPLVMIVGLLMYSFVARQVYRVLTSALERIPVIKSIYGMIVDVVRLFGSPDQRPFRKVVVVQIENSFEQIGFLTRDNFDDLQGFEAESVAVYLPMSYQLGGFTVIVSKARVREIDMTVEEALRFCVTAGVAHREE